MRRAHLLRWRPRQPAQRTESTPRRLPSGAASQLDPSHRSSRRLSDRLLAPDICLRFQGRAFAPFCPAPDLPEHGKAGTARLDKSGAPRLRSCASGCTLRGPLLARGEPPREISHGRDPRPGPDALPAAHRPGREHGRHPARASSRTPACPSATAIPPSWPEPMRARVRRPTAAPPAAAGHRESLVQHFRHARKLLDEFRPGRRRHLGRRPARELHRGRHPALLRAGLRPGRGAPPAARGRRAQRLGRGRRTPSFRIAGHREAGQVPGRGGCSSRAWTWPTPTSRCTTRASPTRSSTRSCSSTTTASASRIRSSRSRSTATAGA